MNLPQNLSQDEQIFYRRMTDLAANALSRGCGRYSGFLNEREQLIAETAARESGCESEFYGGENNSYSTRKVIGFFGGDWVKRDYPIDGITFTFRNQDILSHRDFLGALMALGIKRELLGDIYTEVGFGIVYCISSATELILDNIRKIGKVGVSIEKGVLFPLPDLKFLQIETVVSSMRLDNIVSGAVNLSREKTSLLIKNGAVMLNYFVSTQVSVNVKISDVITVKGFGKFYVKKIGDFTKKGRIHIVLDKYN